MSKLKDTFTPKVTLPVPFSSSYKLEGGKGKRIPRVSTVLSVLDKPMLVGWKIKQVGIRMTEELSKYEGQSVFIYDKWIRELVDEAKKHPKKVAGEAANLGTRVHDYIEKTVKGEDPGEIDSDMVPSLEAWKDWKSKNGLELLPGEICVGSKKYGYAGRLDQPVRDKDGNLGIVDYKTGGIWPEAAYQQAAYVKAWNECFEEKMSFAWVVSLPKDPTKKFEAKKVKDLKVAFKMFKVCLDAYYGKKEAMYE